MKDLTRKENKELNVWALGCLQCLAKAKRKDRTKLVQKYREEIMAKGILNERYFECLIQKRK